MINGVFIGTVKNEKKKQEIEDRLRLYEIIGNIKISSKPQYQLSYGLFWLDHSYQLRSQTEWEAQNADSLDLSYPIKNYTK